MRRLVVIAAVTVLALIMGFSTSQAGSKFEIGPKAGMNLMTLGGDDANSFNTFFQKGSDYSTGVTAGVFGRLRLNNYIAVQMELVYVQKGSEWTFESYLLDSLITTTQWIRLNYIEIPALVSFQVPTGSAFSPFFFGGGSVGINTSSEFQWKTVGGGIVANNQRTSKILNASSIQFNLVFGGGIGIDLGANRVELIANYSMGLSNAFEDVYDVDEVGEYEIYLSDEIYVVHESGEAAKLKTRQFSILAQLAFGS